MPLSKTDSAAIRLTRHEGIFCGFGLALALWLDFATSYASSSFSWRFPLAFPIVLSAIVMAFIFTLPDSPRWLIKCGRETEAREILSLVHDVDPNDSSISQEITDIKLSLDLAGNTSLRSLFRMGKQRTLHRVLLGSLAQIMLQMTGVRSKYPFLMSTNPFKQVNSITYYASTIYEVNLGFSATEARILAAASQFCIIIGSIICSWTVDHLGRRTLMLASAASQCVCFAFLTGLSSNPDNKAALKACVFFLYLYYICYVLGFLGIPFLYASEIAPVSQRAAVCGISTAVSWLFNFLVAEVTPVAFTDIGYRYFIVYAVLNAAFVPTIYFAFPETAGRDLEEIDEIFAEATGIWDAVKVSKKLPRRRLADFRDRDEVEKVEGELGIKGIDGPGTEAEHVELKDG